MTRPVIKDNDTETITVSVDGEIKQTWIYNRKTRSEKMRQAHYFCDGYMCAQGASLQKVGDDRGKPDRRGD